jgi:hypothetical protein
MKRMGIEAIYRRPKTSKPARDYKTYPYLLRGVTAERPNQVGPSNRQSASMRSLRRAARKVAVFQWPCGTLSTSRSPFDAQPRRRSCWSSELGA